MLAHEPPGTLVVCPVCYWQDALANQSSHNVCSLWRSQENFDLYRASHDQWLDRVRKPLHETQIDGWRPINPMPTMMEERDEVLALIEDSFRDVRRGDGVTLHETRVLDNYGSNEECRQARTLDTDDQWQEVYERDLEKFGTALCFLDHIGFRYYLPAYMTWELRCLVPSGQTRSWLTWTLSHLSDYSLSRFRILNREQCHAVYRYLRFIRDYADPTESDDAHQAMAGCWQRAAES